jgi:hypothetical protein
VEDRVAHDTPEYRFGDGIFPEKVDVPFWLAFIEEFICFRTSIFGEVDFSHMDVAIFFLEILEGLVYLFYSFFDVLVNV